MLAVAASVRPSSEDRYLLFLCPLSLNRPFFGCCWMPFPSSSLKMTSLRKTLHPLQSAAGDKENLVGPGRMLSIVDRDNLKASLREVNENDKTPDQAKLIKRKKTISKGVQAGKEKTASSSVTAEDLTTESDNVSENYWHSLAEQRRVALEVTLKENEALHKENEELTKKVTLLEEENRVAKELLQESETLVDVLKEMIGGGDDANESSIIDNSYEV
ncbi:geminin isoform X2 [Thrips palmi]|uniref:Geminin isoform X2 n=2 Tax=Thrips palmi TaxID=161013 RepID=A0A6P8Y226_THRPL|nr:geminin isoform X2 [Thrips palmi]